MTLSENTSRRLAVLLVAPEVSRHDGLAVIGHAETQISDSESTDYAELLSAGNYRFDIVTPEQIDRQLLVENGSLNYSTIILAVSLSRLTSATLSLIHELSYDAGVSLIAGYDHPDEKTTALFGIERFAGTRTLRSSKARIVGWPHTPGTENCVADYGVRSGFAGVRRRGLRKLSWKQTFIKGLNLARNLRMPYIAALPVPGAKVLLSTMGGEPLAWSHQFGNATNYYFALHGDLFLDKFNEIHRLVRSAIETNSGHGMASVDLDRAMVIRLDDPGASKADYQIDGQLLNESEWLELGRTLKAKKIPLSVMYTPGWVDDGDAQAGRLFVDDKPVAKRLAGDVQTPHGSDMYSLTAAKANTIMPRNSGESKRSAPRVSSMFTLTVLHTSCPTMKPGPLPMTRAPMRDGTQSFLIRRRIGPWPLTRNGTPWSLRSVQSKICSTPLWLRLRLRDTSMTPPATFLLTMPATSCFRRITRESTRKGFCSEIGKYPPCLLSLRIRRPPSPRPAIPSSALSTITK